MTNTASGAESASAVKTANALATNIREGKFENATASFSKELRAALTPGSLRHAVGQLSSLGEVERMDPAEVTPEEGFQIVIIREYRTHGAVDMSIVIDRDGKVAGLHYAPAQGAD